MKKLLIKICITLVIVLITTYLGAFPTTCAAQTASQDQARAFIENALPVDLPKHTITLTKHSTIDESPIAGINGLPISRVIDSVRYTLVDTDESTVDVLCLIQNNALLFCKVTVKEGQIISDKQYVDLIDAVKDFLEKYQNYTKIDSTNLIAMLDNVDIIKDSTITLGNTKLTISNTIWAGKELTRFNWADTVNGVDYTSLQVSFQKNGILYSLYDDRAIYIIGDTSVNISSEQAIDIAMKYLPNYSYDMPNNTRVSGFNVTEDLTTAKLVAAPIHSTELRPYWNVKLYLNQTYPGSVKGLSIYIWANSGELFSCNNIAMGGVIPNDSSDFEYTLSSGGDNPLSENSSASPDMGFAVGIAVVVIGFATTYVVILKKRKK